MHKKIVLFFASFVLLFSFNITHASVLINEVMYDLSGADTGREWIEIYNDTDAPVDLSSYKFFEANTNHGLILNQGSVNITAKAYALIVDDPVKFKIDWPNFSGIIFDSSFSLANTGENIGIKDESLNMVDQYTYSSTFGGAGDGNSLQKISGNWVGALPTPGVANETASVPSNDLPPDNTPINNTPETIGGSGQSNTEEEIVPATVTAKPKIEPKIKTKILANKVTFTGFPVDLQAISTGLLGEIMHSGKYFWNFGDGNSKEINDDLKFSYVYAYPGEYSVSLEYYASYYSLTPEATSKIIIKVVPMALSISRVGDAKDFFVEIANASNYDIDLS